MARRGRPPLPDPVAIRAYLRFVALHADGRGITAAEDAMVGTDHGLGCRQAVRKRRTKGEALAFLAHFSPLFFPSPGSPI